APVDTAPPDTSGDASVPAAQRAPLAAGAVVLAVVLVVILVVAGIVAVVAVLGHGGEETAAVASGAPETPVASGAEAGGAVVGGSPASESSRAAATSIPPGDRPFSDPVRHGETTPDPVTDRADIPVNAELVGWTLREATARREIWMSDDPDARILVAATPTPLGTQEELDARMLAGLGDMAGVRVTSRGPVDYEEHSGRSTTRWQVRLIDGHQVSVGCQYRAGTAAATGERLAACDRFTATARVGLPAGERVG
ncbi:type VII secretion-associated protein, partial [uncultured Corynebacterium sp.]|uniref:type VII secretion-associated protein n=1 Tax=uncultured Corynebacterium sp. TaxID=159447 RepID=UPI0025E46A1C